MSRSKSSSTVTTVYHPVQQHKDDLSQDSIHTPPTNERGMDALYRLDNAVILRLVLITAYLFTAFGVLVWVLCDTAITPSGRALRTGKLPVDQFYSGLALSTILAPAAIIARMLSNDMQFLHPLHLASKKRIGLGDLDRMTDYGLFASVAVSKYSAWCAVVQMFAMLVGALLVPLGTLMLTTGKYGAPIPGEAVVGIPNTHNNFLKTLSEFQGYNGTVPFKPTMSSDDLFLTMVTDTFKGAAIGRTTPLRLNPGTLGPIETVNVTFTPEVRYNGIVTFDWAGNCQKATDDDITYEILSSNGVDYINVTFADGKTDGTIIGQRPLLGWVVTDNWTPSGYPLGGTHYIVHVSNKNLTSSIPLLKNETETVEFLDPNFWVARLKCNPTMSWQVSSCVFDGSLMTDCHHLPDGNTTEIDSIGLNNLQLYYGAVLAKLYFNNDYVVNVTLQPGYVSTKNVAYDTTYGMIAHAMIALLTGGMFGTATVPTVGTPSIKVYIVRLPILITFVGLLALLVFFIVADIVYSLTDHLPFRKLTFLTIASIVRGSWWDKEFAQSGAMSNAEMRQRHRARVGFGVDVQDLGRIGLGPYMHRVNRRKSSSVISVNY